MYFLHLLAGITLGWMMFGCAPIKRHDRLVKKYPFVHKNDTVIIKDTVRIFVPKVRVDTLFHVDQLYDTIHIVRDRLSAKIFRVRDSVYVVAQCDTIYREIIREHKVPVIIEGKTTFNWLRIVLIICSTFILGMIINFATKWIQP